MRDIAPAYLLVICVTGLGVAESYRFDMGSADSPVAEGYVQVTPQTMLAASPAFGWERAPSTTIYRNDPANPYFADADTSVEYALYSDGVLSLEENSFVFQVEAGRYAVTAVIGDLSLDEWRPANSIWANGVQVAKDEATSATVKAFRFPVEAAEGTITLRFRADSLQKYSTVIAVTAEPLADGEDCPVTVTQHPAEPTTPEQFRRNWARHVELLVADWQRAKSELLAEGIDVAAETERLGALKQTGTWREYFGFGFGSGQWDRLAQRAGDLDISRICRAFAEMGADGFLTNSPAAVKALHEAGLKHGVSGTGEGFPREDMTGIALDVMRKADGSEVTIPRVWSNCDPAAQAVFRETWEAQAGPAAEGASLFMIDEPRGMWGSGQYGDHSAPAQEAFMGWARERGYEDLGQSGIPDRGRTMSFYRFYQFRMESVPRFVRNAIKGTSLEGLPIAPGNGNLGPETVNHGSNWPPAMAKYGLVSACWAYDSPASCKMYAETLRTANEHGGRSIIVPPMYSERDKPVQEIPMIAACVSALSDTVCPWHMRGPTDGPDRWMKAVYLGTRLTHATSGLEHTPPLYVWCPDSIAYNDLVEQTRDEAEHWARTCQCLFDANLDYGVTNTLAVPEGATVLWSCARPVLDAEELVRLIAFVNAGGRLVCSFTATPETPDGRPIAAWEGLRARATVVELSPTALPGVAAQARNLATTDAAVKTYLYLRGDKRVHLANNTEMSRGAEVTVEAAMRDAISGRQYSAGEAVALGPGRYVLLAEE